MRRSSKAAALIGSSLGVVVLGFGTIGRAQVVADGTINPSEGYNLEATQTINTGFGDSTVGDGTSGGVLNWTRPTASYPAVISIFSLPATSKAMAIMSTSS